jgi:hypothetical protein
VGNSGLILSRLRSPTWKPLGDGKTYPVADSSLSHKQLPNGKNVNVYGFHTANEE